MESCRLKRMTTHPLRQWHSHGSHVKTCFMPNHFCANAADSSYVEVYVGTQLLAYLLNYAIQMWCSHMSPFAARQANKLLWGYLGTVCYSLNAWFILTALLGVAWKPLFEWVYNQRCRWGSLPGINHVMLSKDSKQLRQWFKDGIESSSCGRVYCVTIMGRL